MSKYKNWDIVFDYAMDCISGKRIVQANLKADEDHIPFFWWEEMGWLTLYAAYLFRKRAGQDTSMPRYLRLQLNNLKISQKGKGRTK